MSTVIHTRRKVLFGWLLFGLIAAGVLIGILVDPTLQVGTGRAKVAQLVWLLTPLTFGFVGALIISHHPRNNVGLMMILPGITIALAVPVDAYIAQFADSTAPPSALLLLALWFSDWNWLLLIMPILFLLVVFPTGHPRTPRWRLLNYGGLCIGALMIFLTTFADELGPVDADWSVVNPIGFIPTGWIDSNLLLPVAVAFLTLAVLCAAALFVRFHHARTVEREQIKWLLFAGALVVAVYFPTFLSEAWVDTDNLIILLFFLSLQGIPVAVAIAILRYRLYAIDVIIRKTLVYALLTATLVLIYFGSVMLFQRLFGLVTGQQSTLVVVLSTLLLASLFNPLRRRVQQLIERRFYRRRYNAEPVLARFAQTARDEVDLEALSAELLSTVNYTVQSKKALLWLRPDRS